MSKIKMFIKRRDGRIEVRLNDAGRNIVYEAFGHVVAAERDPDHDWHRRLNAPIDPSSDDDNPLAMLTRQSQISTNAELAYMTRNEEFINEQEAWAWLTTMQIALRETAASNGILNEEKWNSADSGLRNQIQTLQAFLFELAECF